MFLLIDNYDSFTYNLWHYLGELGAEVVVKRNDTLSAEAALALKPQGIVISPGPSDPDHAGICLDLVRRAGSVPVLGVCLGHQAIGQAMGGRVVRAPVPMHGKVSRIRHGGASVFAGRAGLPPSLTVTAETEDGIIMGLAHRERPLHGVQFHPESIASEGGHDLLRNFLRLAAARSVAA